MNTTTCTTCGNVDQTGQRIGAHVLVDSSADCGGTYVLTQNLGFHQPRQSPTTTITVATYWGHRGRVLEQMSRVSRVEFHNIAPLSTEINTSEMIIENQFLKDHEVITVPADEWTGEPIYDLWND